MENKMNIISKIYEITDGKNIADLINEFETNYKYNINLKYIDEITECPFELKFNEDLGKLEIY